MTSSTEEHAVRLFLIFIAIHPFSKWGFTGKCHDFCEKKCSWEINNEYGLAVWSVDNPVAAVCKTFFLYSRGYMSALGRCEDKSRRIRGRICYKGERLWLEKTLAKEPLCVGMLKRLRHLPIHQFISFGECWKNEW